MGLETKKKKHKFWTTICWIKGGNLAYVRSIEQNLLFPDLSFYEAGQESHLL